MNIITQRQCRTARLWLDWNQPELAEKAGLSPTTICSFECGANPHDNSKIAIRMAFERAGVVFRKDALTLPPAKAIQVPQCLAVSHWIGWTVEQLAERSGIERPVLVRIERRFLKPKAAQRASMRRALKQAGFDLRAGQPLELHTDDAEKHGQSLHLQRTKARQVSRLDAVGTMVRGV